MDLGAHLKNEINDTSFVQAAECLKSLAHPMRLKLLMLLESNRLTVGELAEVCKCISKC